MSVDQGNFNSQPMADDDLPDWLREIRGTTSQPEAQSTSEPAEPAEPAESLEPPAVTEETSDLPTWLQEVEAEEDEEDVVGPPADLPATPTASDSDEADDDWRQILAAEGIELDTLPEDRPEGAEDMSLQAWLAATSEDSPLFGKPQPESREVLGTAFEAPPEPASEATPAAPEATPAAPEATPVEDELGDDWLQILADEGIELDTLPEDRPEGAEDMSLQDWLAATSEESPLFGKSGTSATSPSFEPAVTADDDDTSSADELPDWLREDQPTEAAASTPSWLADEATSDAVETAAAGAEEIFDDGMVVEDELPDWLREDQPTEAAASTPSWLADEAASAEAAPAEPSSAEPSSAEVDAPAAVEAEAGSAFDDGIVIEDELPDWLREDQPVEAEAASPSWLTDESVSAEPASAGPVPDEVEAAAEEVFDDGMVVEDELPDWLREDQPVEAAASTPSWLTDESVSDQSVSDEVAAPVEAEAKVEAAFDDGIVIEDELPDWLREGQSMEGEAATPSWLADEATSDEAASAGPALDEVVAPAEAAVEAEATFDDGIVIEDELPDWLREDQPVEGEAAAPAWLTDETIHDQVNMGDEPLETSAEEDIDWLQEAETVDAAVPMVDDGSVDLDDLPDWLSEEDPAATEADMSDWLHDSQETVSSEISQPETETPAELPDSRPEAGEAVPSWLEKLREDDDQAGQPVDLAQEGVQPQPVLADTAETAAAKLAVAKATLAEGDLEEALKIYQDLIGQSQFLSDIITVLTEKLTTFGHNPAIYELLGDAQAQNGQLNQALEAYKQALANL